MADRKENSLLDILKFIAAVMITASHCLPLVPNDSFIFYYGQWFFRFCIPLYFISSGFFFSSFQEEMRSTYIKRISAIYLLSTLLYIPVFKTEGLTSIIRTSILGYHHLWYLSALLIALMICHIRTKIPFIDKIYNRVILGWLLY